MPKRNLQRLAIAVLVLGMTTWFLHFVLGMRHRIPHSIPEAEAAWKRAKQFRAIADQGTQVLDALASRLDPGTSNVFHVISSNLDNRSRLVELMAQVDLRIEQKSEECSHVLTNCASLGEAQALIRKLQGLNGVIIRPNGRNSEHPSLSYSVCVRPDDARMAKQLLAIGGDR